MNEKNLQKNYNKWTIMKPKKGGFKLIHNYKALIIVIYHEFIVKMRKMVCFN